jgi:hypothetical protein
MPSKSRPDPLPLYLPVPLHRTGIQCVNLGFQSVTAADRGELQQAAIRITRAELIDPVTQHATHGECVTPFTGLSKLRQQYLFLRREFLAVGFFRPWSRVAHRHVQRDQPQHREHGRSEPPAGCHRIGQSGSRPVDRVNQAGRNSTHVRCGCCVSSQS